MRRDFGGLVAGFRGWVGIGARQGVSDSKGPISFGSAEQSIERMARVLASDTGPYKGARTIQEIGKIYAPPGAGNDPNGTNGYWPSGVSKFYQQLGGDPTKPVK